MILAAVTISLVPEARGGPFIFWDDLEAGCRKASKLSFHAVEVFAASPHQLSAEEVYPLLQRNDLRLAAVGTGAGWVRHRLSLTDPSRLVREQAKEFIENMIDAAGRLDAPVIVGSMQGRAAGEVKPEAALVWLRKALADLGEYARRYAVPVLFEPLNRYETNLVNSIDEGAHLIQSLQTTNVKLLADLFHMNVEDADIAAAIRRAGSLIGHVHFADSNRRPVGLGHTDMAPVVGALKAIGYDGYVSAETLPYPDPDAAAQQTMESFRKFFR
jgi:sugar phosphate isomerase/epimerase